MIRLPPVLWLFSYYVNTISKQRSAFKLSIILSQRGEKYTRSEWCTGRALAFKPTGRGFAPRQSLSFSHVDVGDAFQFILITPTPLRPVDTYTLYFRREETKYNRSGWCTGRALALNTIGRGFWWLNEATPFNL